MNIFFCLQLIKYPLMVHVQNQSRYTQGRMNFTQDSLEHLLKDEFRPEIIRKEGTFTLQKIISVGLQASAGVVLVLASSLLN